MEAPMAQAKSKAKQIALKPSADAVKAQFAAMASAIPLADDTDAAFDIVAQIMGAADLSTVDKPWQETDQAKMTGKQFVITGVTRRESDFKDGLGMYLRIEYVDIRTGEAGTFSTGSVNIVAQVVKMYALDALPVAVLMVEADKPSKNGYFPQHLEILSDQSAAEGI